MRLFCKSTTWRMLTTVNLSTVSDLSHIWRYMWENRAQTALFNSRKEENPCRKPQPITVIITYRSWRDISVQNHTGNSFAKKEIL